MKCFNFLFKFLILCVIAFTCKGAQLNLPNTPLFIGNNVPPNVFIEFDDSGSMDWEFLLGDFWEACAYDPNITGIYSAVATCGSLSTGDNGLRSYGNGSFRNFYYIFNNSDNVYNPWNSGGCGGSPSYNAIEACPQSGIADWRAFTSSLNKMYYEPNNTYTPWIYNCTSGTPCANANFTSARSYPISGTSNYSLTRNLSGFQYNVWIDDKGYTGSRPLRAGSVNVSNVPNGMIDLWDSRINIVITSLNATIYSVTYAPNILSLNPTVTLQATITNPTTCYNILGSQDLVKSIFNGQLSYTSTDAPGCRSLIDTQTNIANWYSYNRRRSMAARGAVAFVINQYPDFRYGFNTINNNFFNEVPPLSETNYASYNTAILSNLMNMKWEAQGTPLRSGLDRVGQYFSNKLSGKDNPITESCQQNYAILMTDGFWDNPDSLSSSISDVDKDGISKTLADVAYYYYKNDLSTLANNISPSPWDPATWQHMVTFTMAFGLQGNLVAGSDGWPTPSLAINSNWGNPFTDQSAKADDLWHAAFNSRGYYFNLNTPDEVGYALESTLSNITLRNASNTSVAQNSSVLNLNATIYQATFNSVNWEGDLQAFSISPKGDLSSAANWSAQCLLTGGRCTNPQGNFSARSTDSRTIITRNWTGDNNGIAFRWPTNYTSYKSGSTYPSNLQAFLAQAPYPITTSKGSQITANNNYGRALLNFIRGDRSNEVQNKGTYSFRNRSGVLGDIIDSNPVFVPAPYRNYTDSLEASPYSKFISQYANRDSVIYVGSNDGMLHGFNAQTGQEMLAYIPGIREIYQNLPELSSTTYSHYFFVNGSPTEADAYISGGWKTILGGSLQRGGQGVYALNITDPSQFKEANANQLYLWEFTDQNDPDLGYVFGSVTIAKVRTGLNQSKWAMIFGNGYNNSQSDGYASTTGQAALFILFIEQGIGGNWVSGTNYIKIPVGPSDPTNPNGLAQAYAVTTNNNNIVDYVYAGDLKGNLWKFDLRDSTPSNWISKTSKFFTASFASAGDQPITAPLIVTAHPTGIQNGVMIYFGTGKYLEPTDQTTASPVTQSFYGIWDKLDGTTVTKSKLIQQQILGTATTSGSTSTYRILSDNTINWSPPNQNLGWYIDLQEQGSSNKGERQVTQPVSRNGNIIFSTFIPNISPCSSGGSSWLMEVNAQNGGSPNSSPFDVNNDGSFNEIDYLPFNYLGKSKNYPAAGILSTVGVTAKPSILMSEDKSFETKVLSGTQGLSTVQENPAASSLGRQNWRQLY